MATDIKKTDYTSILSNWASFIKWLGEQFDENELQACMHFEIEHRNRASFIDRARTRFNRVRNYRELKEIESLSGQVINVNFV